MLKSLRAGLLAAAALCLAPMAAHAACPTAPTYTGLSGKDAATANQTLQTVTSAGTSQQLATPLIHGNDGTSTPKALSLDANCNLMEVPQSTENHIGNVTGQMTFVATTPTTTAATRASGDVIGGLLTFSSAGRVSGGTGLVQSAIVDWKSTQSTANAAMDIFLFSDTTLSSTCANASAFVLSASDWAKVVGVIHLTDTTVGNTTTHVQATGLALPYSTVATTLYGCAITRGAPVVGSTSDITVKLGLIEN